MRKWRLGTAVAGCVLFIAFEARAQDKIVLSEDVNIAIRAYVDCVGSKGLEWKSSADPSEVLVDRAIEHCAPWRDLVRDELMRPPLNASSAEAESATQQMLARVRPRMIADFKRLRGI